MREVIIMIVCLGCASVANAISGTVTHIDLTAATAAELAEGPLPRGRLVQSTADPKVVYIGDGYSVPGISLWNFAALTNPPPVYPYDVQMDHHHVRLDGSYSLNAEAGRLTAWYGTNAVWQIIAAASAADDVLLSVAPDGTNMAFTVASESDEIVVEVCSSLLNPIWTPIAFGFERLTPFTVKVTVPNPPVGEMQYVRILTGGGDVGMVVSIPLSVPSLSVGGEDVTAESISAWNAMASYDITTNLIANWTAAFEWGNHALAGYVPANGGELWNFGTNGVSYLYFGNSGISIVDGEFMGTWGGDSLFVGANGALRHRSGSTNYFMRPDGGTNTVSFDADGNMIVSVDGITALTIRTNGYVGIKSSGNSAAPLYVNGNIYANAYADVSGNSIDPSGSSSLLNLTIKGFVTATQGVSQIILPTATNGLVPGTLWNNAGTVSVMP